LLGLTGLRNEVCGRGSLPIAADVQRERWLRRIMKRNITDDTNRACHVDYSAVLE